MRRWILIGMLLLGIVMARPAHAFGDCDDTDYVAAFDVPGRLSSHTCREVARAPIHYGGGSGKMRLLVVDGEREFSREPDMRAAFEDMAGRIGTAMSAMGGLRVDDVSILITRLPNPAHGTANSFNAEAVSLTKHGECFVSYYWPDTPVPEDFFRFLIAHETFHCITDATLFHAGDPGRNEENLWWFEGTAEYFANLAYPGKHYSDQFLGAFDQGSPRSPLWSFSYPSVVFFLWLSQTEDPAAVSRFMRNIASEDDGQESALRRVVSAEAWKEFAEDYLDGEIRQPGGRVVPVQPQAGRRIDIDGPSAPVVATAPYVVHRERWRFRRGKAYELRQETIDPGVSVGFSRDGGKWQSPPDTVLACDQDVVFRVLATTVDEAGEASYRAQPRPGMESPSACCMVGEWQPTEEARVGELAVLRETGAGPIAAAGGELSCALPEGDWRLRFGADGRGELAWQDFAQACEVGGKGGAWRQRWLRSGSKTFEWSSATEGAASIRHVDNTMSTLLTVDLGRARILDQVSPDPGPSSPDYGIAVTCLRDDLRVEGLDGLGHRSETYRRVPPPTPAVDPGSEGQD